ncbi:tyrosine-type recombinase/integrase [Lysinibacillus sp. FSL M8-0355]|uniref:tyrosine-type recombinase/integrase n=1 Tax=Lysinibacillus sp. FSL M8-0355 TaxID=2921719 RepID=UPI0030F9E83F
MTNVVPLNKAIHEKQMNEIVEQANLKKLQDYKGEFNLYVKWAKASSYPVDSFETVEKYLLEQVQVKRVKLNTFNRKHAALKFYLEYQYDLKQTDKQTTNTKAMRALYKTGEYMKLASVQAKTKAENKDEVLGMIDKYDTKEKSDIRKRAILLVNLITANRPSEMVTMKVSDFNLDNNEVLISLHKQGVPHKKRLTIECVNAVKKYIKMFDLNSNDYFVGKADKHGNYSSAELDANVYNKHVKRWLNGLAPYSLRKTQITNMYKNGADIPVIAKQTGHSSKETITKHYIDVYANDVDQFL